MKLETIQVILQFMERAQLSGKETPVFNKCVEELHKLGRGIALAEQAKELVEEETSDKEE